MAALVLAACGVSSGDPGGRDAAPRPVAPSAAELPPELAANVEQADEFVGTGVDDLEARLARLRGHPVVVNQWGSWCDPCRFEIPFFRAMTAKYADRVAFVGIDMQDDRDAAEDFMRKLPCDHAAEHRGAALPRALRAQLRGRRLGAPALATRMRRRIVGRPSGSNLQMKASTLVASLAAAVSLAVISGCGGSDGGGASDERAPAGLQVSTAGWKTDFSKHEVPLSEFRSGGPGRDWIPPIDKPRMVSQQEADEFLDDREPVLVVEQGRAVRAYPIQILVWHEIVNDQLGGRPIAVTYCPLCNWSVVFDRRVDGRVLTFGTTGNLRNSDLVMWDRQTESWWQQLSAEAVVGKLSGERLEVLPSQTLSWADFRRSFPEGDVLSRDTGFKRDYGANPYVGYDERDSQPFLFDGETDDRLPAKEHVIAVFVDERRPLVIPFSRLVREPAVNAESRGTPIVAFYKKGVVSPLDNAAISRSKDVGTSAAFDRRVDGRTLAFRAAGGRYDDRQTGSTWDITGRAIDGPLKGKRLRALRHDQQFWFALAAFLPEAKILR